MLLCFNVPIRPYMDNDPVINVNIYIECGERMPSREQVINRLNEEHQKDLQYPTYLPENGIDKINAIKTMEDYPWLSVDGCCYSTIYCRVIGQETRRFTGSVSIVEPIKI